VNEQEPETTETDAEAVEAAPPEAEEAVAPEQRGEAPPEAEEAVAPEQRGEAPARGERRRPRYISRRKVCFFCAEKVTDISYKNADTLRRYLSDRGKIEPRRKTGTCAKHQRRLTLALKHARHLALLPYTADHIRVTGPFPSRS
jgi:small subunit ribosomal protein S18